MSDTSSWSFGNTFGPSTVLAQTAPPSASGALVRGSEAAAPATPGTAAVPGTVPPVGPPAQQPPSLLTFLPMILIGVFLLILMSGGPQRREKKRLAQLMSTLKRNDRVLTIGGIIGTVHEVRDDEVVLKVDENANTRMRFTKNAIQQVLKSADGPAAIVENEPKVEVRAGKTERVGT